MKKILLLFLPVILSCSMVDHDVKIVVENNSNKTVENIRFSTTNDKEWVWFDALEPSESVSKELNVKNYNADGNYTFEYITDDGKLIKKKGNYLIPQGRFGGCRDCFQDIEWRRRNRRKIKYYIERKTIA